MLAGSDVMATSEVAIYFACSLQNIIDINFHEYETRVLKLVMLAVQGIQDYRPIPLCSRSPNTQKSCVEQYLPNGAMVVDTVTGTSTQINDDLQMPHSRSLRPPSYQKSSCFVPPHSSQ